VAPRVIRITDEIHQVGGPELTAPNDAAVYLLNFDGHPALMDAGCGRATETLLSSIEGWTLLTQAPGFQHDTERVRWRAAASLARRAAREL
jgi:hypothetical protein